MPSGYLYLSVCSTSSQIHDGGFFATDLSPNQINAINRDLWRCSDFGALCTGLGPSHGNAGHRIIWIPTVVPDLGGEGFDTNLEFDGNAVVLHIGDLVHGWKKENTQLILRPGYFLFFMTHEIVHLPFDIDGNLFMNPRTSNMGLLFFTLGHVDPGFHGHLTASLLNATDRDVFLNEHDGCLYLVLSRTSEACPPHPCHLKPQLELADAERNLYFAKKPGFALTSADFVTRTQFNQWLTVIVTILVTLLTLVVSIILRTW